MKKVTSQAKLKNLQLELCLEPARAMARASSNYGSSQLGSDSSLIIALFLATLGKIYKLQLKKFDVESAEKFLNGL